MNAPAAPFSATAPDDLDRRIVQATQRGLPLAVHPFDVLAQQLGTTPDIILERMERLLAAGIVRRIAAVPNHYRLGYLANGMSVWDVDDSQVTTLGPRVGALACVSHCYLRPRQLPYWRYNLFAMVHGRSRTDVDAGVERIAGVLGAAARARDVLFSTRILKKTGMRISPREDKRCSG